MNTTGTLCALAKGNPTRTTPPDYAAGPAWAKRIVKGVVVREWDVAGMRMDKWLWAARFFKTRSLATKACELGRIASNGQRAKASRDVRVGDLLQVRTDAGDFQVEVLLLSEMRGPAAVAQTLYRETQESREARLKLAEERKTLPRLDALPEGRPTKRDRRKLDRFRGRE